MKRGDIVLIKFPFTDLTSTKVRPALIISNENYITTQNDVILTLITSNVSKISPDDYFLDPNNPEFSKTGLKQASVFRVCVGRVYIYVIKGIEQWGMLQPEKLISGYTAILPACPRPPV